MGENIEENPTPYDVIVTQILLDYNDTILLIVNRSPALLEKLTQVMTLAAMRSYAEGTKAGVELTLKAIREVAEQDHGKSISKTETSEKETETSGEGAEERENSNLESSDTGSRGNIQEVQNIPSFPSPAEYHPGRDNESSKKGKKPEV